MPQEKTRPGFMLYFCDWDMPRRILDAANFKEFFDAVFNYAQSGEIIRNRAQNEYGMIRRERADTRKIYIQIPDSTEIRNDEEQEEPRFELLDVLLGTLDRLHIGI